MPPFESPYSLALLVKSSISHSDFWKKLVIPVSLFGMGSVPEILSLPYSTIKQLSHYVKDEEIIKLKLAYNQSLASI